MGQAIFQIMAMESKLKPELQWLLPHSVVNIKFVAVQSLGGAAGSRCAHKA